MGTAYTVRRTLYGVQYTPYTVRTLYAVQYTPYSVRRTVTPYIVQGTLYGV